MKRYYFIFLFTISSALFISSNTVLAGQLYCNITADSNEFDVQTEDLKDSSGVVCGVEFFLTNNTEMPQLVSWRFSESENVTLETKGHAVLMSKERVSIAKAVVKDNTKPWNIGKFSMEYVMKKKKN